MYVSVRSILVSEYHYHSFLPPGSLMCGQGQSSTMLTPFMAISVDSGISVKCGDFGNISTRYALDCVQSRQ